MRGTTSEPVARGLLALLFPSRCGDPSSPLPTVHFPNASRTGASPSRKLGDRTSAIRIIFPFPFLSRLPPDILLRFFFSERIGINFPAFPLIFSSSSPPPPCLFLIRAHTEFSDRQWPFFARPMTALCCFSFYGG